MIEYLEGRVLKRQTNSIVVFINGVGYAASVPLCDLYEVEEGSMVRLWVHTKMREDDLRLYGFLRYECREFFSVLITVSGIGPKVALAILSTISPEDILTAVYQEDPSVFTAVPGVGKQTAEKLMVQLKAKKDRLDRILGGKPATLSGAVAARATSEDQIATDVRLALENLGYKGKQIRDVMKTVEVGTDFTVALKSALSVLSGNSHSNLF